MIIIPISSFSELTTVVNTHTHLRVGVQVWKASKGPGAGTPGLGSHCTGQSGPIRGRGSPREREGYATATFVPYTQDEMEETPPRPLHTPLRIILRVNTHVGTIHRN